MVYNSDGGGFMTPELLRNAVNASHTVYRQYSIGDATLIEFIDHLTTVWANREVVRTQIEIDIYRSYDPHRMDAVIFDMHRRLEMKARDKIIVSRELTRTENFQANSIIVTLTLVCIPQMPGHEGSTDWSRIVPNTH